MNKGQKNMKWTSHNQQQSELNMRADINREKKHIWYCELIIAACVGASITLAFVIVHTMLSTKWVW